MYQPKYSGYGSDDSLHSQSPSVFSYESSDEEGHFSYSESSIKYDEDSFDLDSGFKKLRITDNKDDLPVQYNKSGPIGPIFPSDIISNFKKNNPEYFGNIQLVPHNRTIFLLFSSYHSNFTEIIRFIHSRVSIHNKKYIQHLALDFASYNFPGKEFRNIIEFLIKSFPSTKYLYLNFREPVSEHRTDQDLIWLGHHITKYMPNLKHFFLQFNSNDVITSEGFKQFCRQIAKRSKRLECLSLDFSKCQGLQGKSLKSLTHYMSTCLLHLKGLRLEIQINSEDDMKYLSFNKTRCLKQLEGLDLCINQDEKTNMLGKFQKDFRQLSLYLNLDLSIPINLDQLSSSYLQPIENLRSLNLYFTPSNDSQEEAQKFVETVNTKIKTLDHLKINFTTCLGVIQEFLASLKCLENNNHLKKLELGFDSGDEKSPIRNLNVELFPTFTSNFLQNLKNLTYLDLRFQTLHIQDPQVKNLAACIAKDLVKLEFLNIYFFLCPKITKESVKAFQEEFCTENTLLNLKSLVLSFNNCIKISKRPIRSLRSALKKRTPTIESALVNFIDYLQDSIYGSSDPEDRDYAEEMFPEYIHEETAFRIHPDADPEDENNWRLRAREVLVEHESPYYESDSGEDSESDFEFRDKEGRMRRAREESEYEEEEEDEDEEGENEDEEEGEEEEEEEDENEDEEEGEDEGENEEEVDTN